MIYHIRYTFLPTSVARLVLGTTRVWHRSPWGIPFRAPSQNGRFTRLSAFGLPACSSSHTTTTGPSIRHFRCNVSPSAGNTSPLPSLRDVGATSSAAQSPQRFHLKPAPTLSNRPPLSRNRPSTRWLRGVIHVVWTKRPHFSDRCGVRVEVRGLCHLGSILREMILFGL